MFEELSPRLVETSGATINVRVAGAGPPVLLLHGYPQTHVMWHAVAPRLAESYTVVLADLRGYGDSDKPSGSDDHREYAKRAMARDQVEAMSGLGHERFAVVGHDRGARVGHRLALDHPDRVTALAVLDVAPTYEMFRTADDGFGRAYFHWFFLIQPDGLPERLIGNDPEYWVRSRLGRWSGRRASFDERAVAEYVRCFSDPAAIHGSCEDYRAAATIDLRHDEEDLGTRIACPLLALWGREGFVGRRYDVLRVWRERAEDVRGGALPGGHFLPEEAVEETSSTLRDFLADAGR